MTLCHWLPDFDNELVPPRRHVGDAKRSILAEDGDISHSAPFYFAPLFGGPESRLKKLAGIIACDAANHDTGISDWFPRRIADEAADVGFGRENSGPQAKEYGG